MNMPTETFLTTLYTIVDDWYQQHGPRLLPSKVGKKPLFSDSEVMTLSLAQHWLGVPDEGEFLRLVRNNFLPLFPRLVSQSQFNRRARCLCWVINALRQHLIEKMGITQSHHLKSACYLIDRTPVHLRHWRRFGQGHLRLPEAALGYCASKKETYYGFRLLALTTLDGIFVGWDLFAANLDEREAAQDLLDSCRSVCVLALCFGRQRLFRLEASGSLRRPGPAFADAQAQEPAGAEYAEVGCLDEPDPAAD